MVPHIARILVGGNYTPVMAPEDMPIGIVTGLIGGIFLSCSWGVAPLDYR